MAINQMNFLSEGYLGLFGFATDKYCLISDRLAHNKICKVEECLGVEAIPTQVSNFSLSGIMSNGNSRAVLVPYLADKQEVERISKTVKTVIIHDKFTALGNLIAANDKGGIISDVFSPGSKAVIDDALGITTVQGTIAGCSEVGALCLATNKGFVTTPDTSDDEMRKLEKIFGVPGGRASANMGSKLVGVSILANSNGIITGEDTTPIEMEYIIEALGFL